MEKTAARIAYIWLVNADHALKYLHCIEASHCASLAAALACLRGLPKRDVTSRLGYPTIPPLVVCDNQVRS